MFNFRPSAYNTSLDSLEKFKECILTKIKVLMSDVEKWIQVI